MKIVSLETDTTSTVSAIALAPGRRSAAFVPSAAYRESAVVRSYEVGRNGHPRLGTLLRYLEMIATDHSAAFGYDNRWYAARNEAWVVREVSLLIGHLPTIGDAIEIATWVSEYKRVQALREYTIWHTDTQDVIARAQIRWAYLDHQRGQPQRVPQSLHEYVPPISSGMRARRLRSSAAEVAQPDAPHVLQLVARETETDVHAHINNCVYGDWLAEGQAQAAKLATQGHTLHPRYYHIEYLRQTRAGDAVRIETQTLSQRARGLTINQRILNETDGTLVMRAQSEHLLSAAG